eukprot:6208246-Pleurochrysis_carterae.AAC.1
MMATDPVANVTIRSDPRGSAAMDSGRRDMYLARAAAVVRARVRGGAVPEQPLRRRIEVALTLWVARQAHVPAAKRLRRARNLEHTRVLV